VSAGSSTRTRRPTRSQPWRCVPTA
jgi:hypothetical protein